MSASSVRSAVTLVGLVVLVAVMAVVGYRGLTAPFPGQAAEKTGTTCQNESRKTTLLRKEVTVSVYNATKRKGLADRTMSVLENKGFRAGSVGNAPDGAKIEGVQVWASSASSDSAKLVAEQFDPPATVKASEDELGPGVDVLMGTKSRKPTAKGPTRITLAEPVVTCLDDQKAGSKTS